MDSTDQLEHWQTRLRSGDVEALEKLFTFHRSRLRKIVRFRLDVQLQGRVDPSDVLQEVYLDAVQRLNHYRQHSDYPFFVWLREITTQRLIDVHRRHLASQKRTASREVSLSGLEADNTKNSVAFQLAASLTSPSQALARLELVARLREAIDSLDPIDREVLAMRHFEELTNDEVATALGLKKSAASNRYVRALMRLKAILDRWPGVLDAPPSH